MASLFQKFQQAVKLLARSPTLAKNGRQLQFQADINRLFLYTCYNRLGNNAGEADAEEIIDMASKASLSEQEKQVQENVHEQVSTFCKCMDDILLPDSKLADDTLNLPSGRNTAPRLAVGISAPLPNYPSVATKPLRLYEVSNKTEGSHWIHSCSQAISNSTQGCRPLFVDGEADAGSVIAFYPGVAYSPAYYCYILGYPRVDLHKPYLITRYDGTVINAQPWGAGGETREIWDSTSVSVPKLDTEGGVTGSDRVWKLLSKPPNGTLAGV